MECGVFQMGRLGSITIAVHLRPIVEENVKTVIAEEPLNGSKKVDGTTRNTDHTATVRWSDIVKNGGPGSIGDKMSSKEKGKSL